MKQTALLIVDLQNDYFPGGRWELSNTEAAAAQAAAMLDHFREQKLPVIHVRHEFPTQDAPFFAPDSEGAEIHPSEKNIQGEPVIVKHQINSFKETGLKEVLDESNVGDLVICGAMSHMCIDAVARAAHDLGYNCTVIHDACATLDVAFESVSVPAKQVHAAVMAALDFAYANVISATEFLSKN